MVHVPDSLEHLAAVDLGSNSFHMIIARAVGVELNVVDKMRERVQLAAGLDEKNNLSDEAAERGLACLERFGQRIATLPRPRVRAVGTNTMRKARNAKKFLEQAKVALGHPIEIISGREEARLVYLGVSHAVADDSGRRLVIDIGGGSTECIIGERFRAMHADSLHMGCVSYTLRFFGSGKLRRESFKKATLAARLELATIERSYRKIGWASALGSSGTINAIAEILQQNGWSEHGITFEGMKHMRKAMIAQGTIERLSLPGLEAERAPVIAGGLAILYGCFKSLRIDRMVPSGGALREGLVYDMLGRIRHEDVRDQTIQSMTSRYAVDVEHAEQVAKTAENLLGQVRKSWDLQGEHLERMLRWASYLHEIGLAVSYSGYHKHGAYLVANSDMSGFAKHEQDHLAALIRAHRRRLRPEVLQELSSYDGETGVRLALLLRLAVTLNRSRSTPAVPDSLAVEAKGTKVILRFPENWLQEHAMTRGDMEMEADRFSQAGFTLDAE